VETYASTKLAARSIPIPLSGITKVVTAAVAVAIHAAVTATLAARCAVRSWPVAEAIKLTVLAMTETTAETTKTATSAARRNWMKFPEGST